MGKYRALCWGSRDRHTTEKVREAGCEETTASWALWSQIGLNGIPGASWQAVWGRRDNTLSGDNPPCDPQTPANTKLHFNNLEIKDSLEPIFTSFKLQPDFDKEILY